MDAKGSQGTPKGPQGSPQGDPRNPKGSPRDLQGTPRDLYGAQRELKRAHKLSPRAKTNSKDVPNELKTHKIQKHTQILIFTFSRSLLAPNPPITQSSKLGLAECAQRSAAPGFSQGSRRARERDQFAQILPSSFLLSKVFAYVLPKSDLRPLLSPPLGLHIPSARSSKCQRLGFFCGPKTRNSLFALPDSNPCKNQQKWRP